MTSKTELYNIALKTIHPLKLKQFGESGHVSCALESINGNIFTGVCIDLPCALGFCAEQAAIAEVLSAADREIELLRQDIEQEKQKKKSLMQLLLTGIVRVRV